MRTSLFPRPFIKDLLASQERTCSHSRRFRLPTLEFFAFLHFHSGSVCVGSKVCSFVESSSCSSRCLNLTIAKTWRLCIIRLCQIIQLQIIKIFQFPCASVVSSIQPIGQRVVMYLCNLVMHTQWMESAELCINLGPISDSVFDSIHVMALSSSSCFITGAIPAIALDLMGN